MIARQNEILFRRNHHVGPIEESKFDTYYAEKPLVGQYLLQIGGGDGDAATICRRRRSP